MSCCGTPVIRKSDEPEYPMSPSLAAMVSSWESACPGIIRAVHEDIANGDWDRQEAGLVPPYEPAQAFAVALQVLEATLLAQHVHHQYRAGSVLVRWGITKPSRVLPAISTQILDRASQDVATALAALRSEPVVCAQPPANPVPAMPSWNNPQVSMTYQLAPSIHPIAARQ